VLRAVGYEAGPQSELPQPATQICDLAANSAEASAAV
jgi:hypothetical protein